LASQLFQFSGIHRACPTASVATPFAIGLENPRRLLVLPNGDVIVAEQQPGYLPEWTHGNMIAAAGSAPSRSTRQISTAPLRITTRLM
jgi:glucose/arabinose dehydrogenase